MPRDKLLTKDQVMSAIRNWIVHHGYAPTVEELRKTLRVGSTRTVLRYLAWLESEGDIERWRGARGLRLLRDVEHRGVTTVSVPLVGEVAAGLPILAEENREAWLRIPSSLAPSSNKYFLLRIRGNSMNRARVDGEVIENGDLVLVRRQSTADEGAIVVALIDGEATVKRISRGPGYYILKPESSDRTYQPIIVDEEFQLQGIVTKVVKRGAELLDLQEE